MQCLMCIKFHRYVCTQVPSNVPTDVTMSLTTQATLPVNAADCLSFRPPQSATLERGGPHLQPPLERASSPTPTKSCALAVVRILATTLPTQDGRLMLTARWPTEPHRAFVSTAFVFAHRPGRSTGISARCPVRRVSTAKRSTLVTGAFGTHSTICTWLNVRRYSIVLSPTLQHVWGAFCFLFFLLVVSPPLHDVTSGMWTPLIPQTRHSESSSCAYPRAC